MSGAAGAPGAPDREAAVAALRREFAAGLPDRLAILRDALATLARGDDAAARDALHRGAHSLKGTAAAYGAAAVAACARTLEDRGRRWNEAGGAPPDERTAAAVELDALERAARAYHASVADAGAT